MGLQALVEQAIPLMHTETVLFIHHHQPQAVENDRILEQGMGAHQHLQRTVGQVIQQLPTAGPRRGSRQQGDAHMELRQPLTEVAVMLLGQHLRGGHQGPLPARGNGAEQRCNGNHRFARAHVPLHQTGHGFAARQIGFDLLKHPLLGCGEAEGQKIHELPHKPIGTGLEIQVRARPGAQRLASAQQTELQEQKLIEHQPAPSPIEALAVLGRMQGLQGLRQCRQLELPLHRGGERIRPRCREGQDLIDQAAEPIRANPFGEGIHREKPADAGGFDRRRGAVQHLDQRILKGDAVGAVFHQTTDGHGGTNGVETLLAFEVSRRTEAFARQETAHLQATGRVLQLELNDGEVGVPWADESVATANRGDDRGCFPRHQRLNAAHRGVIDMITGVIAEQVADQKQADRSQPCREFRTHTTDLGDGTIELQW